MQTEFGYKVTVTETVRSQVRQDALYEQGRSQPGPVVTWTRASRHAEGLAVDVMIDGGYDNPAAFARLQQVANEEGLHTLGARDPGHLELPTPQPGGFTTRAATAAMDKATLPPAPVRATSVAEQAASETLARIARVAHVAEVAVTAGVAQVARIATPGAATTNATPNAATPRVAENEPARPSDTKGATRIELPTVAMTGVVSTDKAPTREGANDTASRNRRTTGAPVAAAAAAASYEAAAAPVVPIAPSIPGASAVHAVAGPDQASRVARIDALGAQADAQPVSSMVLNLENGDGGTDRIRVDLRGSRVTSTIDVRDQQSAADLSARTGELAHALESRGLEADAVRVRTIVPERLATDATRPSVFGSSGSARSIAGALATDASNPSRREPDDRRDARDGASDTPQDSHRQRSRREREEYPQ